MQAVRPETLEGAELVSVKNFMLNREGASQNPLLQSFMDMRTKSPALAPDQEEDNAPKEASSIYAMDGILTEQQKLMVQFMGGRAGSSITPYDNQHEQDRKEREDKDRQASRQLAQMVIDAQAKYDQLYEISMQANQEHAAALAELQRARQELAQAEARATEATERVEEHQQDITEATAERREAVAAVEDTTVTINGQTIRYNPDYNRFEDQDGNTVDATVLQASDDPAAQQLIAAQESKREEWDLMQSGRGADIQKVLAEEAVADVEVQVEEAAQREAEAKAEADRAAAEAEAARQELEALQDQQASLEASPSQDVDAVTPTETSFDVAALEYPVSTAPRTASATGETGFVNESPVIAPSMRSEFKASAEGTAGAPETPDINRDNTLGQTMDVAALQQQQQQLAMQRQFGMGGGMGSA